MCHMVGVDGCDDVGTYGNGASRVVGIDVGWAFVQASRKKFAGLRFERLDVLEDQQFVVRARKGTAHTCSGNFAVARSDVTQWQCVDQTFLFVRERLSYFTGSSLAPHCQHVGWQRRHEFR